MPVDPIPREALYCGLDDTDSLTESGTGKLARALAERLESRLPLEIIDVSRHQLSDDPRIPCTKRNKSCCLLIQAGSASVEQIREELQEFVLAHSIAGSDPGICIARQSEITPEILQFGFDAQEKFLNQASAQSTAASAGVFLRPLGGTGDGIIGALAGVGLRASGADGRLIRWRRTRELQGILTVEQLRAEGFDTVTDSRGHSLRPDEQVDTLGKVRATMIEDRRTLIVESQDGVWRPVRSHGEEEAIP